MSSDGSDDEDYDAYADSHPVHMNEKRFPIHDACEFESLEALKVSLALGASTRPPVRPNGRSHFGGANGWMVSAVCTN